MKIFLTLMIVVLAGVPSLSATSRKVRWQGSVVVWHRAIKCPPDRPMCVVPRRLVEPIVVNIEINEPTEPGKHIVGRETFRSDEWIVELLVTWTKPKDGTKPYLATQTRLLSSRRGLIAECSRYDAVNSFRFLPPGSCSGRTGDNDVHGISLLSPGY